MPEDRNGISGPDRTIDVPLVGESILYSVFKKGNRLTPDHVVKLERMIFSTLKDYDRECSSRAINGRPVTVLDIAVEMYSQLAKEYAELLAGVIPPDEHSRYLASPEGFVKVKHAEIHDYVSRKLGLLTLSHCNSWNLSKAMIKLIRMGAAADLDNGRLFQAFTAQFLLLDVFLRPKRLSNMEELYGLRILLRYQSVKDMTDQIIQDIGSEYLRSDESKDSELILSTQWAKKLDKPARIDVECKLTYPGESTRIVRVDLSGLSNLETLERIRLSNAGFTSIDLSALSSLPNLVYLDLAYNELDELDLEPLAMSTSLQYLLVLGNIYESVNIEPIIHLPKLQRVSVGPAGAVLDYTRVLELWRSPKWTKKRKSKELSEQLTTRMSAAIKSFFLEMEKPEWLAAGSFGSRSPDLGQLVSQLGWKRILREWNELPSLTPVQMRKLLNLLEMSELFGFAGDSKDLFSVFPQEPISFEDSRNMIYTGIVDLLAQQIRETGNTQDLDIELMKDKQASVLVHDIIERRRHEVESITLFRKKGLVDVMPLMDTYYGRKILLAMELAPGSFGQGANLNSSDFQRVQAAMENLGLGLQVDEIQPELFEKLMSQHSGMASMYCGKLVRLRAVEESDVDEMHPYLNSLELLEMKGVPIPRSRSGLELWTKSACMASPWGDGHLVLAIENKTTGRFLGITRLEDIKKPHNRAELGISIYDPSEREKGYGTDATRVMLWIAFNILGLHSVYLDTMEDNERSIHVYEKIGFKKVGVLRETEFLQGKYKGLLIMDILRKEFESHNADFSVACN